ncbi:MAG: DUF2779 domain-containing protein [Actinobacteria bacterium]|nr:DUF2779 domain-containing protein [Actinomycetota bacterium]
MMKKIIISKSRYLAGLQCPKYLWYLVNAREEIPGPDFSTRFIFSQGIQVGEYAKKLFPDGIDLGKVEDMGMQLVKTAELLEKRRPIFEAAVGTNCVYSRADILRPSVRDQWDIIEVKSSTQVKAEYIQDVAFQKYTFLQAGINIKDCYLMLVNNRYTKRGEIEPAKLFATCDISAEVDEALTGMGNRVEDMIEAAGSPEPPEIAIGRQCDDPYTCPLKDRCWEFLPENHVFNLYGNKDKAIDLYSRGILSIEEIPEGYDLNLKQQIQRECAKSKKPRINRGEVTAFLEKLNEPLYFFDFETFSVAVPLYEGTKPFQRIPFQYSIHVMESLDAEPVHHDFLATGDRDPRRELIENLKEHLGDSGSIIVYYEFFEKGVLKELAEAFPGYRSWVDSLMPRIVDLYRPFGDFYYYNSSQKGSASVKSVLPAITDLSYRDMDIADGLSASVYYLYACGHYKIGEACPAPEEAEKVRKSLIRYCRMDTGGMIHILRGLRDSLDTGAGLS